MSETIAEGDYVIFEMASDNKKIAEVKANSVIFFGKFGKCNGADLVGLSYDLTYEIDRGRITLADRDAILDEFALENEQSSEINNQTVTDDSTSQKLTHDQIEKMKLEGTGPEIIKAIVENSATFENKTDFAKAKYVRRKAKKFSRIIRPLRATALNLCQFFLEKSPSKIMDMRFDTLSQLLYYSNISPDSGSFLVMDDTQGLLVGAMIERGAKIFGIHDREAHNYEIIRKMSHVGTENLTTFPWSKIDGDVFLDESVASKELDAEKTANRMEKRKARFESLTDAKSTLTRGGFSGLVLATHFTTLPILEKLVQYLGGSSPIVIYSPTRETLLESFNFMRNSREYVNVQLTESWIREYQVPLQGMSGTHPHMTMSAGGGYLLTAIRVFDADLDFSMTFKEKKKPKIESIVEIPQEEE